MEVKNMKDAQRTANWRICIYGKPGVGKTSAVRYLNGKTLVLALDNSAKVLAGQDVDVVEFDRVHPDQAVTEFLRDMQVEQRNYDNLVIDNIS